MNEPSILSQFAPWAPLTTPFVLHDEHGLVIITAQAITVQRTAIGTG